MSGICSKVWDAFDSHKGAKALSEGPAATEEDDRQEGLLGVAANDGEANMTTKSIRNSGKGWGAGEVKALTSLARDNTPTRVIGLKLGRTEDAIRSKASQEGISLKPTNQAPYNRAK